MFDFYIVNDNYLDFNGLDFSIKKNSELPFLEIKPIPNKNFNHFIELLPNMEVYFNMLDINTNKYVIMNKKVDVNINTYLNNILENQDSCDTIKDFTLKYSFTKNETKNKGRFIGEFKLVILENGVSKSLIVPIRNKININIVD